MAMQRLILLAAAALLGGCATGYTYHQSGGGDYYSGEPYTDYHYVPSGGFGTATPAPTTAPIRAGAVASATGAATRLLRRLLRRTLRWLLRRALRWLLRRRLSRPVQAGAPRIARRRRRAPAAVADDPGQLRDYRQVERFGPRGGNPPVMPRNIRRNEVVNGGMPPAPVSRPVQVRTPPPPRVVRPPPPARPAAPSTSRPSVTPSERHERAVDRGRVKSGSGDTP